jgi:hypothetical protein
MMWEAAWRTKRVRERQGHYSFGCSDRLATAPPSSCGGGGGAEDV